MDRFIWVRLCRTEKIAVGFVKDYLRSGTMCWRVGYCALRWKSCFQLRDLSRILAGQSTQLADVP